MDCSGRRTTLMTDSIVKDDFWSEQDVVEGEKGNCLPEENLLAMPVGASDCPLYEAKVSLIEIRSTRSFPRPPMGTINGYLTLRH